eukprot:scaffold2103_cov185-Amphora_coffeaeformis.AAC.25
MLQQKGGLPVRTRREWKRQESDLDDDDLSSGAKLLPHNFVPPHTLCLSTESLARTDVGVSIVVPKHFIGLFVRESYVSCLRSTPICHSLTRCFLLRLQTLFERLNNKENNVHATRGLMTWKGKGASPSSKGSSSKGASPSSKGYSMSYKGKGSSMSSMSYKGKGSSMSSMSYKGKGSSSSSKGYSMSYKGKGSSMSSMSYKGKGSSSSSKGYSMSYKGKGSSTSYKGKGKGKGYEPEPTLADIVVDTKELSTLEFALKAAGLFDIFTMYPLGYTVLAPTDEAFMELAYEYETLYKALLTAPWIAHLQWLLYSHVVEAEVKSTDLSDDMKVEVFSGDIFTVSKGDKICFSPAVDEDDGGCGTSVGAHG